LSSRVPPEDANIWDCRAAEAYRGRGLHPAGQRQFRALESARNIRIACEASNRASRRAIAAAGFAEDGVWRIRRVGPLRFAQRDDGPRRLKWPGGRLAS
jgi:RimJ/RimL family protein N-acetyltransferase